MTSKVNRKTLPPKPNFIPDRDWSVVVNLARRYGQDPYLIAAIGWHETHWGRLGAGRKGYIHGYGVYPGSPFYPPSKPRAREVRGVYNQVRLVARMLKRGFKYPVSEKSCIDFAVNYYKPGVPSGWGRSVYRIYSRIKRGEYTPTAPSKRGTRENRSGKRTSLREAFQLIISSLTGIIRLLRKGV